MVWMPVTMLMRAARRSRVRPRPPSHACTCAPSSPRRRGRPTPRSWPMASRRDEAAKHDDVEDHAVRTSGRPQAVHAPGDRGAELVRPEPLEDWPVRVRSSRATSPRDGLEQFGWGCDPSRDTGLGNARRDTPALLRLVHVTPRQTPPAPRFSFPKRPRSAAAGGSAEASARGRRVPSASSSSASSRCCGRLRWHSRRGTQGRAVVV